MGPGGSELVDLGHWDQSPQARDIAISPRPMARGGEISPECKCLKKLSNGDTARFPAAVSSMGQSQLSHIQQGSGQLSFDLRFLVPMTPVVTQVMDIITDPSYSNNMDPDMATSSKISQLESWCYQHSYST